MSFKAPSDALNTKKLSKYPHALKSPWHLQKSSDVPLSFPKALDKITGLNSVLSKHTCCLLHLLSMQFFGRLPKWFDWKQFTPRDPITYFFPHIFPTPTHSWVTHTHGSIFQNRTPWCSQTLLMERVLVKIFSWLKGLQLLMSHWIGHMIVFRIEHSVSSKRAECIS